MSALSSRQPHIIVVDDDILNRTILVRILESLGYLATAAESGEKALLLMKQQYYDLALMDCQMPGIDGYTTTMMIRSPLHQSCNPDIPVIALTAGSAQATRERCLASGMDDLLIKPVKPDHLGAILDKFLPEQATYPDR